MLDKQEVYIIRHNGLEYWCQDGSRQFSRLHIGVDPMASSQMCHKIRRYDWSQAWINRDLIGKRALERMNQTLETYGFPKIELEETST